MNPLLRQLVATHSGWLSRQILKWCAAASLSLGVWLQAKGWTADATAMVAAFAASALLGGIEFGLSFVARKYAIPEAESLKEEIKRGSVGRAGPQQVPLILLAGLVLCLVPACSMSPAQLAAVKQSVVPLSQIGLSVAVASGKVQPGDAVKIGDGIAIITSADTATEKAVKLSDLGLQAAVDHGKLREGDAILIRTTTAVVASLVTAPATPAAP